MKMNVLTDYKKFINLACYISCFIFLMFHIIYLIFFAAIKVNYLVYLNIASSAIYLILFLFIKYKLYKAYVIITALEIAAFMTISSLIVGAECGFQICLLALGILVFFADYFSKFGKRRINAIWFCILNAILFTFIYIYFKFKEPLITINDTFETILFITHIFITFGFSTTFAAILVSYTVKLENKVRKESETDKLTNIPNRKGLEKYFEKIGDQKSNYLVAIFDIDNFKKFNDVNGHLCGDYVLTEIAKLARDNSSDDFVSRWGGEEFVIVSKKCNTNDETFEKIDTIRKTIEKHEFRYGNKKLKSTITIGVAEYTENQSLEDWIKTADKKLYYGKHNGKNQTVFN